MEKLWNKLFREWQGHYMFKCEWNRNLGRNWSYFWEQQQYERKICKKGNFRYMTHLVLISGRGNDSLQWELVGHLSSSTAAQDVNATTAAHQESPGLWRDVAVLRPWRCRSCIWWTLNEGFPATTPAGIEPKMLSITYGMCQHRQLKVKGD